MTMLVVTVAGAIGAGLRYLVSGWVQERFGSGFPLGTLVVNLGGAFLVGLSAGAYGVASLPAVSLLGLAGGFTTYSTWMVETIGLDLARLRPRALINLVFPLVLGITLCAVGYSLGS